MPEVERNEFWMWDMNLWWAKKKHLLGLKPSELKWSKDNFFGKDYLDTEKYARNIPRKS